MNKFPYYVDLRTGKQYHGRWHRFSDGAVTVTMNCPDEIDVLQIVVPHCCPVSEISHLLRMLCLAKRPDSRYCELYLPYLPYARADRRFEANSPIGLSVFVNYELTTLVNTLEVDSIVCVDVHSASKFWPTVGGSLKHKFKLISQAQQLQEYMSTCLTDTFDNIDVVVAPDTGALGKAKEIAELLGVEVVLQGNKERDVSTGRILSYRVDLKDCDLKSKKVLVVDDICDGGGTFILTAEALPKDCKKILYVTHGIFSHGRSELLKYYEEIHTSFPWDKNV